VELLGARAGMPYPKKSPQNLLIFSILTITWAYIRLMGANGLKEASQVAILNANYMAKRLEQGGYRIVYKDEQGWNAHEFIIDCKTFKKSAGVDVMDIAKRLMDYGYSPVFAQRFKFLLHHSIPVIPYWQLLPGYFTFFSQKMMFYKVVCRNLNSNFVEHHCL
jgi:hypothetical protein